MSEGKRYDLEQPVIKKCGSCMYFGDVVQLVDEDGNDTPTKYHTCDRVGMYDKEGTNVLAMVKDGSDCFAALIVASDFGCVLWREK